MAGPARYIINTQPTTPILILVLFYFSVVDGIPCHRCGKTFNLRRSVRQHEAAVHLNAAPYQCCNTNFRSASHLTRHMCSVHNAEKMFECSTCKRKFAINADLQRHMRREANKMQFLCDCGKRFETKAELEDHAQTHNPTSERKNQCPVCNKAYSFKTNMYRHMKKVHDD